MISIVGVHGVWNYRNGHAPTAVAAHLANVWRSALAQGPLGPAVEQANFSVAYYAHRLRPAGTQSGPTRIDALPADAEALARDWLAEAGVGFGVDQGRLTRSLRQNVSILASTVGMVPHVLETFVAVCFGEVARYLNPSHPHRFLARTEVANAIAAAPGPRVVVAHSLGSVVTYETLHSYRDLQVDLLITVGSPLAMPAVFKHLDPRPNKRGLRPPNVARWINLADLGDVIAIPPKGVGRRFDGVEADLEAPIHCADFHLATNYLRTAAVAQVLEQYLGVKPGHFHPAG